MKIRSFLSLTMTLLLLCGGCYKEVPVVEEYAQDIVKRVLRFDEVDGMVDTIDHMIMFTVGSDTLQSFAPVINFFGYHSVQMEELDLVNGQVNELGRIVANHPYQVIAIKDQQTDTFRLIFTILPLIHILTKEEIPDEPKVLSWFEMQYCDHPETDPVSLRFETYAGIEIRGGSSKQYDKKSYGIELWLNSGGNDYSTSLLGMRYGEDWILDAMYIDDLRMRNKISFELWEKMSRTPEEDQKYDVFPGIHCTYVELFINNRYTGLYCLNEKLDERLLHFAPNQHEQGGVMYKAIDWADGSTRFETYHSEPPYDYLWDGWELIYPKNDYVWNPLAELRKTVVRSSDEEFLDEIGSLIDIDNAIAYYLFINLLKATDNTGKNTFFVRYTDQSRFFIIPWDIEATWGRAWDRSKSKTLGIVTNNLFERLIQTDAGDFYSTLESTWSDYRRTIFSEDSLFQTINGHYSLLKLSGAIERENARWEDIQINLDQEYEYITGWIEERLQYLDDHFD